MGKCAFIFPGQGAQYVGMGKEIASEYKSSARVFEEASDALGFDIGKMIFEGDEETLKITENTQPTILTTSYANLAPILERGIKPDYVAGLSLGEYNAHVVSESISFTDTVKLVKKRGKYMQEAVPAGVGTMAAIMGLADEQVIEVCKEASVFGIVEPANFNCPGQIVIAGAVVAIEKAMEIAKQKGAKRAMPLAVSAPFHCSMLKPAGEMLREALSEIVINDMKIPVITNVTADIVGSVAEVKDFLIRQVSNPVRWEGSIRRLIDLGVDTFVEIGPGKVLTGFVKKVSKDVKTYNIEDLSSLEQFLTSFDK
jgi:[acyl-carrier-protein] S-malonyltransferase